MQNFPGERVHSFHQFLKWVSALSILTQSYSQATSNTIYQIPSRFLSHFQVDMVQAFIETLLPSKPNELLEQILHLYKGLLLAKRKSGDQLAGYSRKSIRFPMEKYQVPQRA